MKKNAPLLLRLSGRINKLIDTSNSNYDVALYKNSRDEEFVVRVTDKRTREYIEIKSSDYLEESSFEDFDTVVTNFLMRKQIERQEKINKIIE